LKFTIRPAGKYFAGQNRELMEEAKTMAKNIQSPFGDALLLDDQERPLVHGVLERAWWHGFFAGMVPGTLFGLIVLCVWIAIAVRG
jgi:hypothetical protein